jgi:hypothetical protein
MEKMLRDHCADDEGNDREESDRREDPAEAAASEFMDALHSRDPAAVVEAFRTLWDAISVQSEK